MKKTTKSLFIGMLMLSFGHFYILKSMEQSRPKIELFTFTFNPNWSHLSDTIGIAQRLYRQLQVPSEKLKLGEAITAMKTADSLIKSHDRPSAEAYQQMLRARQILAELQRTGQDPIFPASAHTLYSLVNDIIRYHEEIHAEPS